MQSSEYDDAQIAYAIADAAMKMVLAHKNRQREDDRIVNFAPDASATVAIAYRRAAGAYTMDKEMQELGTAAVHLLTMASSYLRAQKE